MNTERLPKPRLPRTRFAPLRSPLSGKALDGFASLWGFGL